VETDPLRYHGENPLRPAPLDAGAAEQLLAHLAADLARLFPLAQRFGLCGIGALYDQAQVLRPGWPLFDAMRDVARRRWKEQGERTGLLSIGTADGHFPRIELNPDPALPPGMLQLIPLQLHGPGGELGPLEEEMEHRFMEEGQLSPLSARAIENAFGIVSTHARFLTLTDLRAMLTLQLEHFGFEAVSALLDAALERDPEEREVRGAQGQRFRWRDGTVWAEFQTLDYWANRGTGKSLEHDKLVDAYIDWTREYRRVLVTLTAHGVPVVQHLPDSGDPLEGLFLEEDAGPSTIEAPMITEHGGGDLGTLAVSVVHDGRLRNFYPLAPEGSNALHTHIATLDPAAQGVSFPGRVCIDEDRRCLTTDCA
jgi:hypothetical protein